MESNTTLLRIQELCKQRGWSLYKLAKESNIAYSSLNNIFLRNTQPTISTLEKICNGFQISMSDFFNDATTSNAQVLSPDELELLECYRKISKSNKLILKSFTSFLTEYL